MSGEPCQIYPAINSWANNVSSSVAPVGLCGSLGGRRRNGEGDWEAKTERGLGRDVLPAVLPTGYANK